MCIAVNRNRDIEIIDTIKDTVTENYLLIRCKVDGYEMLIGGVYGPNTNNRGFYRDLIGKINRIGLPTIIGGDFNTVLDGNQGVENIDLEDRDNIPQKENGKILREWIEEGNFCDPFRTKYPMAHVMSYKPFRTRRRIGDRWETVNYGKSRLDFFIISKELYKEVDSIYYGERLSKDFDHMEAILKIGKSKRKKERIRENRSLSCSRASRWKERESSQQPQDQHFFLSYSISTSKYRGDMLLRLHTCHTVDSIKL